MFWTAALICGLGAAGAHAQAVYKCNGRSYSQMPCSTRVVRTFDAPVPVNPKPKDVVVHRLPGETAEEFALRKRRVRLAQNDRDECARLDKRIPVERERMRNSPVEEEIDDAQASLAESSKRFRQLRC